MIPGLTRFIPALALVLVHGGLADSLFGQSEAVGEAVKLPGMQGRSGDLQFAAESMDLGEFYAHVPVDFRVSISNAGSEEIRIVEALLVGATGTASADSEILSPGASTEIDVQLTASNAEGVLVARLAVITDEPGVARYRLPLSGFVQSAYQPHKPIVQLGARSIGGAAAKAPPLTLELESLEADSWSILNLEPSTSWLKVSHEQLSPQRHQISLEIEPPIEPGLVSEVVRIETDLAVQPRLEVAVVGSLFEDVVASANPVNLGAAEAGLFGKVTVVLFSQDRFDIDEVVSEPGDLLEAVWSEESCVGGNARHCVRLDLRSLATNSGPFGGVARVRFRDGKSLPLRVYGLTLAPGQVLETLALPSQVANEDGGS